MENKISDNTSGIEMIVNIIKVLIGAAFLWWFFSWLLSSKEGPPPPRIAERVSLHESEWVKKAARAIYRRDVCGENSVAHEISTAYANIRRIYPNATLERVGTLVDNEVKNLQAHMLMRHQAIGVNRRNDINFIMNHCQ